MLLEKQEEIEMLQEKVTLLTLQLIEKKEKISQLTENIKGKQLLDILLYYIICLVLQIKSDDPQLSQKFEKVLPSQQQLSLDDKLTQEPDNRVDDTSKLTSSDHETEDITSQSKM